MSVITYQGTVRNGAVILEEGAALPDGTQVLVTPLGLVPGTPQAVLAAMRAEPHLRPEDVDEFERLIEEGERPLAPDPFATKCDE
jgi:hypothetical protein